MLPGGSVYDRSSGFDRGRGGRGRGGRRSGYSGAPVTVLRRHDHPLRSRVQRQLPEDTLQCERFPGACASAGGPPEAAYSAGPNRVQLSRNFMSERLRSELQQRAYLVRRNLGLPMTLGLI